MPGIDVGDIFDERMIITSIAYGTVAAVLSSETGFLGEAFNNLSFLGVAAIWYFDAWYEGNIKVSGIGATIVMIIFAMQLLDWLVGGLPADTLLFLAYIVVLQNTSRSPLLLSMWIANVVYQGMTGNATSIIIFPGGGGVKVIMDSILQALKNIIESLTGQYTRHYESSISYSDEFITIAIIITLSIIVLIWLFKISERLPNKKIYKTVKSFSKTVKTSKKGSKKKKSLINIKPWNNFRKAMRKQHPFVRWSVGFGVYTLLFIITFYLGTLLSGYINLSELGGL